MPRTVSLCLALWLGLTGAANADASLVVMRTDAATTTALVEGRRLVGTRAGAWAATSRGLVELRVETVVVPTQICNDDEDTDVAPTPGEPGSSERLVAIDEDGTRHEIATTVPDDGESGWGDYGGVVQLRAIIGPYVFALRDLGLYGCGAAHPYSETSLELYDLETQRAIDVRADLRFAALVASVGPRATRLFSTVESAESPRLAGIEPSFDAAQNVQTHAVVTAFSCYACTGESDDGTVHAWGSYELSVDVDTRLPSFLRPTVVSTAVARRLAHAAHTDSVTLGVGTTSAAITERVRASFTP